MRKPCNNCPWRKDAPRGFWDPEHFRTIWRTCQDDGTHIMQCHKAGDLPPAKAKRLVCQGWIRVMQMQAIGVRLALMRGYVTLKEMDDRRGLDLFKSFRLMLVANGIRPPPRNVFVPIRRRTQ